MESDIGKTKWNVKITEEGLEKDAKKDQILPSISEAF